MISRLENQLLQECMFGDHKEPDGCWDSREVAKLILDRLEQEGMLPPIIKNPNFTSWPHNSSSYTINEWEPEDE